VDEEGLQIDFLKVGRRLHRFGRDGGRRLGLVSGLIEM
jgi:hypothetical protein